MNNKKLMISLFSLCLVAIVGLLTTVIVLAAGTQNVSSSIKVSYSAEHVAGSVTATYKLKGDTSDTKMTGGNKSGDASTVEFAADSTGTYTLNPTGEIRLTSEKSYVDLVYTFHNAGQNMYVSIASVSLTGTNLKTTYGVGQGEVTESSLSEQNASSADVKITIRIAIADHAKDASLSNGSITWKLSNTSTAA